MNTLLHTHTELCTQVQPSYICSISHNLSCTCMIPAHSRLLKPQVRLSNLVRTDHLLSSSSPNLLAKAVQELLAVTGPIHVLPGRLLSLHAVPELPWYSRWDLLHIGLLCKEFSSGLVSVCACAGPVIQQDDKPLSGMHNIFLYVTWCS